MPSADYIPLSSSELTRRDGRSCLESRDLSCLSLRVHSIRRVVLVTVALATILVLMMRGVNLCIHQKGLLSFAYPSTDGPAAVTPTSSSVSSPLSPSAPISSAGPVASGNPSLPDAPRNFKVVGLVFYGRRDRVSILDCYLQKNLVRNGGSLDEVVFMVRTNDKEDLAWLDKAVGSTEGYQKVNIPTDGETWDFSKMWDIAEPGVMYIKIDDDIVFIEDTTIPSLIKKRVELRHPYIIGANVINHARLNWVHYKMDAIVPYLPENNTVPLPENGSTYDWRASSLPKWTSPKEFDLENFTPPAPHRWLPTNATTLDDTPIVLTSEPRQSQGLKNWMVGAQQHYSFLHNLESGELWRYNFTQYDFAYERMSINLISVWGEDIIAGRPIPQDDEMHFTETMPKRLKRHVIAIGGGVSVHFSYGPQHDGMMKTDLLHRYRAYAEEKICNR